MSRWRPRPSPVAAEGCHALEADYSRRGSDGRQAVHPRPARAPYDARQIEQIIRLLAEQRGLPIAPDALELLATHCDPTPGSASVLVNQWRKYFGGGGHISLDVAKQALDVLGYAGRRALSADLPVK